MPEIGPLKGTDRRGTPVRGGTKIAPGCHHGSPGTFAERFRVFPFSAFEQGFVLRFVQEKLYQPLRWRSPRKIFVNSMSDLFHEEVPTEYIAQIGLVMRQANWHTYQVLTKRHERLHNLLSGELNCLARLTHIWFGVSVEDREYGLPRVDLLRRTPAMVRYLSIEPLLDKLGEFDLGGIDWVIVGGESGPGARPMEKEWVLSILAQCRKQRVTFFFKQSGGGSKHQSGRMLNGRTYNELPTTT